MDCMTFRKKIDAYIGKALTDDELNEFLRHLSGCDKCREELEINYIVSEGIGILDEEHHDYNLRQAYAESLKQDERHIKAVYVLRVFTYMIDTLSFWGVLLCAVMFLRIFAGL